MHTGELSLMRDNRPEGEGNRCMWRSQCTKLSTDWHGNWFDVGEGRILCHFDCFGQKGDGEKWSVIRPGTGRLGQDYRRRAIMVQQTGEYILNPVQMLFQLRNRCS